MTISQIRLFHIYASSKLSIEITARAIGISDRGVESDLYRIRKELQADLVIRGERNKAVQLTEAGQRLFDYCDVIIVALDRISKEPRMLNPITIRRTSQHHANHTATNSK